MFTGLIENLGKVTAVRKTAAGMGLVVDIGATAAGAKIGDSIAVNGVCLTVSKISGTSAEFDVSGETLARSTLGKSIASGVVNLEQAMRVDGRFGGHIVQGHIDGTGTVKDIHKKGDFYDVTFAAPKELLNEMVVKGSVAVDGISLTVAAMDKESFSVAIIPVTWEHTTLGKMKKGDSVNIETDVIVKTIKKQIALMLGEGKGLTAEKLREMGY
jgi:riboflavin synthase